MRQGQLGAIRKLIPPQWWWWMGGRRRKWEAARRDKSQWWWLTEIEREIDVILRKWRQEFTFSLVNESSRISPAWHSTSCRWVELSSAKCNSPYGIHSFLFTFFLHLQLTLSSWPTHVMLVHSLSWHNGKDKSLAQKAQKRQRPDSEFGHSGSLGRYWWSKWDSCLLFLCYCIKIKVKQGTAILAGDAQNSTGFLNKSQRAVLGQLKCKFGNCFRII